MAVAPPNSFGSLAHSISEAEDLRDILDRVAVFLSHNGQEKAAWLILEERRRVSDAGELRMATEAYEEGERFGYECAQDEYKIKLDDTADEAWDDGHDAGYEEGRSYGYDEGYEAGYDAALFDHDIDP